MSANNYQKYLDAKKLYRNLSRMFYEVSKESVFQRCQRLYPKIDLNFSQTKF